jgi:hypothetical protein
MSLEHDVETARQHIVNAARAMLEGSLSFIEGARRINRLRMGAEFPDFDPDILCFVAIDSETDTLPFGDVRRYWQPEALAKLQSEIDRSELWAQETGRAACQSLIDRLSAATT